MTRHEAEPSRPERVIVVDADNPLQEIHGRFVWQDEHERAVADAHQAGYEDGYNDGVRAAVKATARRRPALRVGRALRVAILVLLALLVLLMLPIVLS